MFRVDYIIIFPTFRNKYSILFHLHSLSQINSKLSKNCTKPVFFIFLLNLLKIAELMYEVKLVSYRNVVLTYDSQ